jgi:hypothetical protein
VQNSTKSFTPKTQQSKALKLKGDRVLNDEILLIHMVEEMEKEGVSYRLIEYSIDDRTVEELYEKYNLEVDLASLHRLADKYFAHEWIEHRTCGGGKYSSLSITPKGIGAARSKVNSDALRKNRSFLKKASDYIDDHKGMFILLGFVIAVSTLAIKIFEKP